MNTRVSQSNRLEIVWKVNQTNNFDHEGGAISGSHGAKISGLRSNAMRHEHWKSLFLIDRSSTDATHRANQLYLCGVDRELVPVLRQPYAGLPIFFCRGIAESGRLPTV